MFIFVAPASILFASADVVLPATRITKIYISGMTCGGCAISVEQVLENTEGVEDARVSSDLAKQ